jgi:hypothetical protein
MVPAVCVLCCVVVVSLVVTKRIGKGLALRKIECDCLSFKISFVGV